MESGSLVRDWIGYRFQVTGDPAHPFAQRRDESRQLSRFVPGTIHVRRLHCPVWRARGMVRMPSRRSVSVDQAFATLQDAIENEERRVLNEVAVAARSNRPRDVLAVTEGLEKLEDFRGRVDALISRWASIRESIHPRTEQTNHAAVPSGDSVPTELNGSRTSDAVFRLAILSVIDRSNGTARTSAITTAVENDLRGVLTLADREVVPGTMQQAWRHAVVRLRNELVREGLVTAGTRRDTWRITEAGRQVLLEQVFPS